MQRLGGAGAKKGAPILAGASLSHGERFSVRLDAVQHLQRPTHPPTMRSARACKSTERRHAQPRKGFCCMPPETGMVSSQPPTTIHPTQCPGGCTAEPSPLKEPVPKEATSPRPTALPSSSLLCSSPQSPAGPWSPRPPSPSWPRSWRPPAPWARGTGGPAARRQQTGTACPGRRRRPCAPAGEQVGGWVGTDGCVRCG